MDPLLSKLAPAASAVQFAAAPIGRWFAGKTFLAWSQSRERGGLAVWGQPTEQDVAEILLAVDAYHRHCPTCDVVTDMSRIESMGATTYAALLRGMRERQPLYSYPVGRQAVVRAEGFLGGLAEGFLPLIGARHSWRVFSDARLAFAWISRGAGPALHTEVEQLIERAGGTPMLLRLLRTFLGEHFTSASASDAANALGLSERTLQRRLQRIGISFREELVNARIEAARRLLEESELKIEAIALVAGFCSHTHLTRLFRRRVGQTPAAYRDERRTARPLGGLG